MDQTSKRTIFCAISNVISQIIMDDEQDSEEEFVEIQICTALQTDVTYTPPVRIKNYIENVVEMSSNTQFQSNFRMTKVMFDMLLHRLHCNLETAYNNRPQHDPKKQLLAVLWLLATPDSYRSVAERFDLTKSSLFLAFKRVIMALNSIASEIIQWPSREERSLIKKSFAASAGLNGVIGAIDGTYVNIKAPKEDGQRYVNRKGVHGITLQAIAIPSLKFIDCFAGYPSSVSDKRVFINSDIFKTINIDKRKYFGDSEFIIGDKAYPVLAWCIPPYIDRGNMSNAQSNFNTVHAKTRQVIERSFALLFGRFRRLKYLDMNRVDLIPRTIIACCVLHNFCLGLDTESTIEEYISEGINNVVHMQEIHDDGELDDNSGSDQNDLRGKIAETLWARRNHVYNKIT